MRLLDLYCGAGGASMGYHRAGFEIVGVDIEPQPDYPFQFIQGDAIEAITDIADMFDAVHASPPCQDVIAITAGNRGRPGWSDNHRNMVPITRAHLAELRMRKGIPTLIECGVGKHLRKDLQLCGEMFGLSVIRHRTFEIEGIDIPQPRHIKHRGRVSGWRHGQFFEGPYVAVYGEGGGKGSIPQWQDAMGIDWTDSRRSIAEAIPPAYTEYIGTMMMRGRDARYRERDHR